MGTADEARPTTARAQAPAQASVLDTLRVVGTVLAPVVGRGVLLRRPRVLAMAERLDLDHRLVRTLQRMRARYGPDPLRLAGPARSIVLVLSPEDVERVLENSPEPFATSTPEKRGALEHFQPHGVLISHGAARADRRRFTETVLDTELAVHRLAASMVTVVREEAGLLLDEARRAGSLDWDTFVPAWFRIVRRIVLGSGARDDHQLTDMLATLRSDANWSFFHPKRRALRERYLTRLRTHLDRAEAGSLAEAVAEAPTTQQTRPVEQVPQWLFAFDAAGMATFRALALLASHPDELAAVRDELAGRDLSAPADLSRLQAALLESVRLWPTTPAILRDTTMATELGGRALAEGALVVVLASFFHRDDQVLPYADRFAPDIWRDGSARLSWSLVPFSAGPAVCAGQNLVLFLTSTLMATLLERHELRLTSQTPLDAGRPLPGTLSPVRLRFAVSEIGAPGSSSRRA